MPFYWYLSLYAPAYSWYSPHTDTRYNLSSSHPHHSPTNIYACILTALHCRPVYTQPWSYHPTDTSLHLRLHTRSISLTLIPEITTPTQIYPSHFVIFYLSSLNSPTSTSVRKGITYPHAHQIYKNIDHRLW